mmetsp:Transcript_21923/g.89153  ORF Transcript_21923/g.89153 Transcript_21923/m.89153 type:complete len:82 (+) Transcript_21923:64-309(+)
MSRIRNDDRVQERHVFVSTKVSHLSFLPGDYSQLPIVSSQQPGQDHQGSTTHKTLEMFDVQDLIVSQGQLKLVFDVVATLF